MFLDSCHVYSTSFVVFAYVKSLSFLVLITCLAVIKCLAKTTNGRKVCLGLQFKNRYSYGREGMGRSLMQLATLCLLKKRELKNRVPFPVLPLLTQSGTLA